MSGAVRETTKYFDFEIPSFDFPGWHVYYDRNIKTVDTILYLMTGTDSLKGIWKNSESYDIGDRVVDINIAFAYECFVQHVSAPVPTTFAEDRNAHPNYWHPIDFIQALAGTSSTEHTISLGHKAFVTQSGRIFNAGAKVMVSSATSPPNNWMWGGVVSYDGQQLVLDVEVTGGSGTYDDWLLSVSGVRGPQGEIGPIGVQGPQGDDGPEGPEGPTGPQGIIAEAPTDGGIYGRKGDTASWTVVAATSATSLPTTPAGNLQSTNVQAALNELDNEKVGKAGDVMTGPLTLFGAAHWKWVTGTGAGSYFDTFNTSDRFFIGTDSGTDTFRIFSYGSGSNALAVDGSTGRISVIHPPTLNTHIATKQYVDTLVTGFVSDNGDTMTGILTVPTLQINHPSNSDIWFQSGGSARWLIRSEPLPSGDINFHRYDNAGGYLGSILTLSRLTHDATFQQDVIVTRNLRTSGSLAVGANVTTGFSGDGSSVLIRAYGAGGIYMQYAGGAAHYARFGYGSSDIYGTLGVSSTITAPTIVATGNLWAQGGVLYMSAGGHYMQWTGSYYTFPHGHIYSPAGRLYGTNDFNPASFVTNGSTPSFAAIEGPYYIDMFHPGHGGDFNARLIVHGDHTLQISSAGLVVDNWINVSAAGAFGGRVSASGFKSYIGENNWHFGWSDSLYAYIDGGNWGSILNVHQSDYRIKKDVVNLESKWDVVKALRPIRFTPADYAPYSQSTDEERWGFIAHELQATLVPQAASDYKDVPDKIQQLNLLPLLAALCKALQEAMTRIEALEAA